MIELSGGWLSLACRTLGPLNGETCNLQESIRNELVTCIEHRANFALIICPSRKYRRMATETILSLEADYPFFANYVSNDRPLMKYVEEIRMALGEIILINYLKRFSSPCVGGNGR